MMKNLFSAINIAKLERCAFALVVLITLAMLFYPPYLPMVDLAQHAGQVSVLDDLLKNKSVWQDLVYINWDTPYLIGYSTWLLLYQFTDIVTSSKILVALVLLFYIYSIHLLRKNFQTAYWLEWGALTVFFGFAFQWGFITFLMAIPVGILFFLSNKSYLEQASYRKLIAIFGLGILTYCSHVLIFSFFCLVSYAYFLLGSAKNIRWKQGAVFTIPYLVFALMLLRYVLKTDTSTFRYYSYDYLQHPLTGKLFNLLIYPWNMIEVFNFSYMLACVALLILPPLLGYRLRRELKYYAPIISFFLVWFIMPHNAFQTAFLYQRFAIFFIPFYYLIWQPKEKLGKRATSIKEFATIAFFLSCGMLMYTVYSNQVNFKIDPQVSAYQHIASQMQANKRTLMMFSSLGRHSGYLTSNMEFIYFGNWYQAEKHGWTDFNFAAFHPQIVRFKPEQAHQPENRVAHPAGIKRMNCQIYDYILVKAETPTEDLIKWFQANPTCQKLILTAQQQQWRLFTLIERP